jgi:predicted PhzF superfamily epimerase YddE/YHI9
VPEVHVVRVFTGPDGREGNALGVVLDGGAVPDSAGRQALAARLGFSETVFVDDRVAGRLRIFTPTHELPLAGHPLVGTAWVLARAGFAVDVLRPPAGEVPTWAEGEETWIRARPEHAPDFELRQLASPAEVEAHPLAEPDELLEVWAWEDEGAGEVRARVFAPAVGVKEDEATGSAALRLCALLARPLRIRQGRGSLILARPAEPGGAVEVGGRCALDEVRDPSGVALPLRRDAP